MKIFKRSKIILVSLSIAFAGVLLVSFQNFTPIKSSNSITKYPKFKDADLCFQRVTVFNEATRINEYTPMSPDCPYVGQPMLFSATHESKWSTHWQLLGPGEQKTYDRNHSGDSKGDEHSYMADYQEGDLGNVLNYGISNSGVASIVIDTLNFPKINSVTGRSFTNGTLFAGLNDQSIENVTLDTDFFIEFSYRIRGVNLGIANDLSQINASRSMVAFLLDWPEHNSKNKLRVNRSHFLEFDLHMSPNYFPRNKETAPCPADGFLYDHCYNDMSEEGTYVEGKYASINKFYEYRNIPSEHDLDKWYSIKIPLSTYIRRYAWMNRPPNGDWSKAKLAGMYFGVESQGASRLWVEIKDYQMRKGKLAYSNLSEIPEKTFRIGSALYENRKKSYCAYPSDKWMLARGLSQIDYENSPFVMGFAMPIPYEGACPLPIGLYRADAAGIYSDGSRLCVFKSGADMQRYGFTQSNYNNAKSIGSLSEITKSINLIECR